MKLTAIGRGRLEHLAALLESEAIAPEQFDMDSWSQHVTEGQHDCGYAACAIGWATTIPEFVRDGLHLRLDGLSAYPALPRIRNAPITALSKFFELKDCVVKHLFFPGNYEIAGYEITPAMVAERIRAVLNRREKT